MLCATSNAYQMWIMIAFFTCRSALIISTCSFVHHHHNQGKVSPTTRTFMFYWLMNAGRLADSNPIDSNSNIHSVALSICAYLSLFTTSSTALPKLTWLSSCDYQEETTAKQRFLYGKLVMKSWRKEETWCHQQTFPRISVQWLQIPTFRIIAGWLRR